jgi:hypothetical protein
VPAASTRLTTGQTGERGREVVEHLDPVHRAEGLVVAVHEAGRGLVVPVEEDAVGRALLVHVLLRLQEAAPLVAARAERRQTAIEAG